jgi:2-succinyl-5-enolpyruvyl-6-hydroxy-3-cyclohexene-1-carboxylate synthase
VVVAAEDRSAEARAWVGSWVSASRRLLESDDPPEAVDAHTDDPRMVAEFTRRQLAVFREPVTRRMLAEALWRVTWPHDRLVLAASRLIREVDKVAPGKKIRVHANRGLAGIDGTIATALGIALTSQAREDRSANGVTRVLLGDLAMLHDVGALLFGVGEARPRIQLIVGNDGGGTIFDQLEVAQTARDDAFDRVLYTPQSADFAGLAAGYGWDYLAANNRGELDQALSATAKPTLVEVPLPRVELHS